MHSLKVAQDHYGYGSGANIMIDQKVIFWYAAPLTKYDEQSLGIQLGDDKTQQTLECRNLLVAHRTWKEQDNITALTMMFSLTASSVLINKIARDVALERRDAAYRSNIADVSCRFFRGGEIRSPVLVPRYT